jgi:xylulose-5-phosphate/fructose-6-phosphate phosphoketolase
LSTSQAPSSDAIEQLALYRRASNYIAAAMIYLQDNALLEEPLKHEHIKHRLLGHWGTVPGINLVYAGLNRLILNTQASILLVTGPGHGAPANLANLWIDGCLEDTYPKLSRDRAGVSRLIHDFSWPGGFPSHVAPIVPGTIHEGGELGYALATAFGAALDNPDLIVAAIIGDGEAETGPTAVPRSRDVRRRAPDPPPQRLQDRQPDDLQVDERRGADEALRGLRLAPVDRGWPDRPARQRARRRD